jgi:putative ABC transport system permease protein
MALSTIPSWLGGFALDFRLAARMLVRYPLLTIVSTVGMAAGVAAGVAGFEIRTQAIDPRLPLDDGHRIAGIRHRDLRGDRPVPVGETDFRAWLDRLRRFEDLGAVALAERNLSVNGNVEPIAVAEMTASGFRIARVPPLLGRAIAERDEAPGAPPIAVIGYALWQRTFLGDPNIIGRSVRLGGEQTTIVGVMPQDFGFPVSHQIWTALRRGTAGTGPDAAPLLVFGRLAPGVTIDGAQARRS